MESFLRFANHVYDRLQPKFGNRKPLNPLTEEDWLSLIEDAHKIRATLVHEFINTQTVFMLLLYFTVMGLPSGIYLTALLNSYMNSLMNRYSWRKLVPVSLKPWPMYYANVRFMAYGDDLLNSPSLEVSKVFNIVKISELLAKHGFKMTSADKTELRSGTAITEMTYLKNGFLPLGYEGHCVPLMDMTTITDLIQWVRTKNPSETYEMTIDNCRDSQELMFFYGKEAFDTWTSKIKESIALNMKPRFGERTNLYSWDDLCARHEYLESVIPELAQQPMPKIPFFESPDAQAEPSIVDARSGVTLSEGRPIIALTAPGPVQAMPPRDYRSAMPDADWSLKMASSRWTLKTSALIWTAATTGALLQYNLPWDLLTSQLNAMGFERFDYVHFDSITIRLQVNGTNMHQGILALYVVPCQISPGVVSNHYVGAPTMWTPLNPGYVNASSINATEIEIPFRNIVYWLKNMYAASAINFNGILVVEPYAMLRYGPSATTSLPVSVQVAFNNPTFALPSMIPRTLGSLGNRQHSEAVNANTSRFHIRHVNRVVELAPVGIFNTNCPLETPDAQGASSSSPSNSETVNNITLVGGSVANSSGPTAETGDAYDHADNSATATPTITASQGATGGGGKSGPTNSNDVANTGIKALHSLGAKAIMAGMDNAIYPGPLPAIYERQLPHFGNSTESGIQMQRMTYIPGSQNIARMETFDTDHDEMSFANLYLSKFTHKDMVTWDVSQPTGTVLMSWPITPFEILTQYIGGTDGTTVLNTLDCSTTMYPTLLERIFALGPTMWRGSYRSRIMIVKTPFHQGRLAFGIFPNTATLPTNISDFFEVYSDFWDVNDQSIEKIYSHPFMTIQPYLRIPNGPNPYATGTLNVAGFTEWFLERAVGVAALIVATPLVATGTVSTTVDIIRQIAGNPDLEFKNFNTQNTCWDPINIYTSEFPEPAENEEETPDAQAGSPDDANAIPFIPAELAQAAPVDVTPGFTKEQAKKYHDPLFRETISTTKELLRRWVIVDNVQPPSTNIVAGHPVIWAQTFLHTPPIYATKTSATLTSPGLFAKIGCHFAYYNGSLDWHMSVNTSANVYGVQPFATYAPNLESLLNTTAGNDQGYNSVANWIGTQGVTGTASEYGTTPFPLEIGNDRQKFIFCETPMAATKKALLNRPVAQTHLVNSLADVNSQYFNYDCLSGQLTLGIIANQATGTGFGIGDIQALVMLRPADDFRFGGFVANPGLKMRTITVSAGGSKGSPFPDAWRIPASGANANFTTRRRPEPRRYPARAESDPPPQAANFNSINITNSSFNMNGEVKVTEIAPDCFVSISNFPTTQHVSGTVDVVQPIAVTTSGIMPVSINAINGTTPRTDLAGALSIVPMLTDVANNQFYPSAGTHHSSTSTSQQVAFSTTSPPTLNVHVTNNPLPVDVTNSIPQTIEGYVTTVPSAVDVVSGDSFPIQSLGSQIVGSTDTVYPLITRVYAGYNNNSSEFQVLGSKCDIHGNVMVRQNDSFETPDAQADDDPDDHSVHSFTNRSRNNDVLGRAPDASLKIGKTTYSIASSTLAIKKAPADFRIFVDHEEWGPLPATTRHTLRTQKNMAESLAALPVLRPTNSKFWEAPDDSESENEEELTTPLVKDESWTMPIDDFVSLYNCNIHPHRMLARALINGPTPNSKAALHNFCQGNGYFGLGKPSCTSRPGVPGAIFLATNSFLFLEREAQQPTQIPLARCKAEGRSKAAAEHAATENLFRQLTSLYEAAQIIVTSEKGAKLA